MKHKVDILQPRKAPRKTDRIRPDELDVTALTDDYLRDELLKHGVDAGPIVASTRKLYEKKLQKLLDDGPAQTTITKIVVTDIQVNHNGNSESDLYSDKEDDVTAELEPEPVAEPEPEPEPVPVVERPVRSRGKMPLVTRTRSSEHKTVEKIAAHDQTPKVDENDILKELFVSDVNSPTGIMATCRRPIRGAAGRPVISSDLWNAESSLFFSPKTTKSLSTSTSSSYTESRVINRINSLPNSSSSKGLSSRSTSALLSAPPPSGPTKVVRPGMSLWKKVLLVAVGAAFMFFIYQAMETNTMNPFSTADSNVASKA
ncbi:thymopoietin a isoform X2 [Hippocampus comes]|uniref:thymopoietin a isoform X2 n=1 Tax=Hippocampus comes TaxID=109280 RepID=UPI00094EEAE9|nr:PREDICTED: thymopoietin isoform X2 [Hippocampus comes]